MRKSLLLWSLVKARDALSAADDGWKILTRKASDARKKALFENAEREAWEDMARMYRELSLTRASGKKRADAETLNSLSLLFREAAIFSSNEELSEECEAASQRLLNFASEKNGLELALREIEKIIKFYKRLV